MRLLVIEPYADGHRAVYVERIVRAALSRGHSVVLVILDISRSHLEYQRLVQDELAGFTLHVVSFNVPQWTKKSTLASEFVHWMMLRKLCSSSRKYYSPDMAFVCYLDYCLHAIALLGSPFGVLPFCGIVMRVKFHHNRMGINTPTFRYDPIKERLFLRVLSNPKLRWIFSIDEALAEWIHSSKAPGFQKMIYLRDPTALKPQGAIPAIRDSGLRSASNDASITILVYGWLNRRKGIQHLLPVLFELMSNGVKVKLLCIGQQDSYVTELLSTPMAAQLQAAGLINEVNRYVTAEEEAVFFSDSDVIWLAYEDFFVMSGVMVQAAIMHKPVLVNDIGLVAWMTEKYHSGLVVRLEDHSTVSKALLTLIEDSDLRKTLGESAFAAYSGHTINNFVRTIFDKVESIP